MSENLPNINVPSGPSAAPNAPKGPDLESGVRTEVMGGLESAIEVTSTQSTHQGDDSQTAAPVKKDDTAASADATIAATMNVQDIPEDTLLRITRKKIQSQLLALDMTAQKIMRSNSPSRAFNFTRVVSEMRRLHISLQTIYRVAITRVRELYTQLK